MLRIGWHRCPYCKRPDIYVSTPKRLWEELAVLLLLQTVRCHDCMHRFFRPLWLATPLVPPRKMVLKRPAQHEEAVEVTKHRSA